MPGYSTLSDFAKRNSLVDELINRYVDKCVKISVGIGAAGSIAGIFIPGRRVGCLSCFSCCQEGCHLYTNGSTNWIHI